MENDEADDAPGWFDLASDQASAQHIDRAIRAGVSFRGTNLWILICATFVASIGLNVNSAAVIIGAMLISPLMGPIMGVGYGAAVNDLDLIQRSLKNLGIAVVFSLLTSALYFLLTPLKGAGSEILARTSPALWDVLIAIFGGLAGIIGSTRREKGNVIPGVAIATALMPPLCTVGYGAATGQLWLALGALYLFTINSVFIAASTFVMVRVMRLPARLSDSSATRHTRSLVMVVVLLTGVPSVWLAVGLVQEQVFTSRAERFTRWAFPASSSTFVLDRDIDPRARALRLAVVGDPVSAPRRAELELGLLEFGLEGVALEVVQSEREQVDLEALRDQVTGDLYKSTLVLLEEKNRRIDELEAQASARTADDDVLARASRELRATFPTIGAVDLGRGASFPEEGVATPLLIVALTVEAAPTAEELARIRAFLAARLEQEQVRVLVEIAQPAEPPPADAG